MSDIIVCVKQVPNTTNIKLDPVHHTLVREGVPAVMNPFDEVALHAALECKSRFGVRVGVLTMGPPQAEEMLLTCLGRGADDAFLLTDRRLAGSDTLATARALHAAIRSTSYRTVFCGQETADSSTGHLGPSLAEMFHVPQATSVTKILAMNDSRIQVQVELERTMQALEMQLPVVVSFAKENWKWDEGVRSPKAGRVQRMSLEDIGLTEDMVGLEGSPTTVVDIDIDMDSLNYLVVDSGLPAYERIGSVLRGGIQENKNRVIHNSLTEDALESLLTLLR